MSTQDKDRTTCSRRYLAATLVVCGLALLAAGSVGAVPKPPPRFWSTARCEQAVLRAHVIGGRTIRFALPTGDGHYFGVVERTCVGSGGPWACRWMANHRARLYSEFRVFTRSAYNGGVVRSFTLVTRARRGLVKIPQRYGDNYVGWPAAFYMSRVKLLATDATAARFRSLVTPLASRVIQQETAAGCTGG